MKPYSITFFALILLNFLFSACIRVRKDTKAIPYGDIKEAGNFIDVDGVKIYYEKHDLEKIKCPVLVLSSDRDIIQEEHTLFIYRNISKANLCLFTGENHYITKNNPDLFNATVDNYFNKPFKGDVLRQ